MSRRWLLSLLCLSFVVVFVQLSSANSSLRVNESATRFLVRDYATVLLEVVNPAAQKVSARLHLELLDPKDVGRGITVRVVELQPGLNKLTVPLTLTATRINEDDDSELPWYRLRYRVDPSTDFKAVLGPATGIISLSEIETPNIFALEVSAPDRTQRAARYQAHIRTLHPINAKPVKNVEVNLELRFSDEKGGTITGSALTDDEGYALVVVDIPAKLDSDEGEMTVVARNGGFVRKVDHEVELNDSTRIMVNTDKPIYQPGQPLHIRALIFDAGNRAVPNAEATLTITDPEDTEVFETSLITSRFGVATADWAIPENTRLGDYAIRIEMDDESYGDAEALQGVKISRYDLPNFAVNVKSNRSYYLPGQNADVEVRADYLFGQPVKRGHVKVVREEKREWDYQKQAWEINEGQKHEGETDQTGLFVAHIDLAAEHKDLADSDYSRFTDLTFAAYFTDPTTNRTKQRRFDLRVTKDSIHIYVAEGPNQQAHGFPMQFYVATSLADGSPAPCEVAISEPRTEDSKSRISPTVLRTIRTNKYGLAKVTGLVLPEVERDGYPSLCFTAVSNGNGAGHHTESFYYHGLPVIRVDTNKPLYAAGEPIQVKITASKPDMNVVVEVARDSDIIESKSLTLDKGAANFTLRYRPAFKDEITISVFSKSREYPDEDSFPFGSRTVLFPRNRDLKVDFRLDHADYKPGDNAKVDFRVSTSEGKPVNSALGVVIFDRAVEERARTDQEFRGQFGFFDSFSQWRGYDNQIAGINRRTLQNINAAKPLPEEMVLAAELLLGSGSERPSVFTAEGFEPDYQSVFAGLTRQQLEPIGKLLDARYNQGGLYPASGESLRRLLVESGFDFDQLNDPWGTPYREKFSVERDELILEIISAGPDKSFVTHDDSTLTRIARPYFRFTGEAISRAVERFHARSGSFIRSLETLRTELLLEGIDLDSLRDPWGQPYDFSFTTAQTKFNLSVRSSGPDKSVQSADAKSDDFTLWQSSINYFTETRAQIEKALARSFAATNAFPRDDGELHRILLNSGLRPDQLHDPWGYRYTGIYKTATHVFYRPALQSVAIYGQMGKGTIGVTLVEDVISSVRLRSIGEDGKAGTADDFDLAEFSQARPAGHERDRVSIEPVKQSFLQGARGAIRGTVVDPNGGAVAGATVTATLKNSSLMFEAKTDDDGKFLLRNLPVGHYELKCDALGFMKAIVEGVPVSSATITTVNLDITPGTITETVSVSAGADAVNVTLNTTGTTVTKSGLQISVAHPAQLATPRLREYFPETLVWQPSLETDKQGRAQLKFKLADNITTWKMSVIGTTEDGEMGTAETEIKSFQPFFLEHDPPRVLTEGDQISLPIVLRNYLERPQVVDLEMKPASWFTLQGAARQRATVPAGDSAKQVFEMRAVASVKDGKQQVTARGSEAGDAIEKPVTVHPDGEEKTQTASEVFGETAGLDINLPASVLPGSAKVELKIYPSLMAHVVESIEGILERPYGCGEQTISSTYPSVLMLRGEQQTKTDARIVTKAKNYVALGYQRLLKYRTADGGFSYWGNDEADLALSAYALRFLRDASQFVAVDPEVIKSLRQWLVRRQQNDGGFSATGYRAHQTADRSNALLTAYVARVLAMTSPMKVSGEMNAQPSPDKVSPELKLALSYLAAKIQTIDEPHLIASYALAAIDAGDRAGAQRAIAKLQTLAQTDGDTTYWTLDTTTPFNGWGNAGRVETTALVIQALKHFSRTYPGETTGADPGDTLTRRGLLFLLRQKDRYGVWYSTQATINVLDTLMSLLGTSQAGASAPSQPVMIDVIVNGQPATSLKSPAGAQNTVMIRADVSAFLRSGTNRVELRRARGSAMASVQLVANYYVPWSTQDNQSKTRAPGSVFLSATFDKHVARINEEIVCSVKADRAGTSVTGMMLAEIGLPPGADVDRASLESAMKNSGWAMSRYDVLPDRIVFYFWVGSGGARFSFKFRPRFALTAKAAPSTIYDYYNPEAGAVVEPATFVVR
ncbi:MAG TPA: MG2 domain-containing protein [Pyrinomonadaceae bacterium]|nr:MG2 domain-containing protein [Pyrinomonadaceae bacterium]